MLFCHAVERPVHITRPEVVWRYQTRRDKPWEAEKSKNANLSNFRGSLSSFSVHHCYVWGLVAGLDAGLIYNEFPWMGLGLTPPKSELFSDFYSHTADGSDVWWRNPLENPSLVQLDHRILATTTFTSVMALWAYSRFSRSTSNILPLACKKAMHGVMGFACLQVALGISTLIYLIPLPLASARKREASLFFPTF